jgi:hypothetical protein
MTTTINANGNKTASEPSFWEIFLVLGFLGVMMLALLFWPVTKQFIPGMEDPERRQALGAVQKVTYVGGFSRSTQIDTATGSYLLRGAILIRNGAQMEERSTYFGSVVCEVGTDVCAEMLSHR